MRFEDKLKGFSAVAEVKPEKAHGGVWHSSVPTVSSVESCILY
jgi:hypothetical protein